MTGTELTTRTASEKLVLRYVRQQLSVNEIAEQTGLALPDVLQKIDEILNSHSYLSMRQEEKLLIMEMQELVQDSKKRLENAAEENYAGIANVVIRAMKEVGTRFDVMRKSVEIDISQITTAQAHVFGGAFDAALKHIEDRFLENHPEIDRAEFDLYRRESMLVAKKKLEDSVGDD